MNLSHLNEDNQPRMVDVGHKNITTRTATAEALVRFPDGILESLTAAGPERMAPKGPVFQTAILAGIQAAKQTSSLIPLCHVIPLDKCDIAIQVVGQEIIQIQCTVRASHKTGVEMEALTGATVAALTVYDMCKALSHAIEIQSVKLLKKTGGKSDFSVDPKRASSNVTL